MGCDAPVPRDQHAALRTNWHSVLLASTTHALSNAGVFTIAISMMGQSGSVARTASSTEAGTGSHRSAALGSPGAQPDEPTATTAIPPDHAFPSTGTSSVTSIASGCVRGANNAAPSITLPRSLICEAPANPTPHLNAKSQFRDSWSAFATMSSTPGWFSQTGLAHRNAIAGCRVRSWSSPPIGHLRKGPPDRFPHGRRRPTSPRSG